MSAKTLLITLPEKTYECQVCRGSGHVQCPNQKCIHWEECTACAGTGKVFCIELMTTKGWEMEVFLPSNLEPDCNKVPHETRAERIKRLVDELSADVPPESECAEPVRLGKPVVRGKKSARKRK